MTTPNLSAFIFIFMCEPFYALKILKHPVFILGFIPETENSFSFFNYII